MKGSGTAAPSNPLMSVRRLPALRGSSRPTQWKVPESSFGSRAFGSGQPRYSTTDEMVSLAHCSVYLEPSSRGLGETTKQGHGRRYSRDPVRSVAQRAALPRQLVCAHGPDTGGSETCGPGRVYRSVCAGRLPRNGQRRPRYSRPAGALGPGQHEGPGRARALRGSSDFSGVTPVPGSPRERRRCLRLEV